MVMASGSSAKKVSAQKPRRFIQPEKLPSASCHGAESNGAKRKATPRNKSPASSQRLSAVNRRVSCRSVSSGSIAPSCLRTTFRLNKKSSADRTSTNTAALKNGCPRHFVLPVKKRAEAEVDEAEEFRAVKGVAPGAFLFLEIAHLPEAVEQQAGAGQRGNEAQRLEPVGACGFRANDQRRGQSPKQRGKSAGEPAERAEQFGIGRGSAIKAKIEDRGWRMAFASEGVSIRALSLPLSLQKLK